MVPLPTPARIGEQNQVFAWVVRPRNYKGRNDPVNVTVTRPCWLADAKSRYSAPAQRCWTIPAGSIVSAYATEIAQQIQTEQDNLAIVDAILAASTCPEMDW